MGVVLAKFRKVKTTAEVLENLEERIQEIEKFSFNTQEQKKRFVGNFLAISIGIYVIAFLLFYFIYFPPTWRERFFYSIPMLLFPVFIVLLRKAFTWYFQRKLNKNSTQLSVLRAEKKKLLEQVMDKETYKVAVALLARFADKTNGTKSSSALTPRITSTTPVRQSQSMRALSTQSGSQLNMSALKLNSPLPQVLPQTQLPAPASGYGTVAMTRQLSLSPNLRSSQELRRRTPYPILNQQNKGVFERIVDVLIGDGPQDRFAMICKECFAHNGMAPKEEFDFATFRCAFCNALNPSRKSRPVAPPLQFQSPGRLLDFPKENSDSSSSADDASEDENVSSNVSPKKTTEFSSPEICETTVDAAENKVDPVENEESLEKNKESSETSKTHDEQKKEM